MAEVIEAPEVVETPIVGQLLLRKPAPTREEMLQQAEVDRA
jgi:hypothetical protein